MKTHIIPESNLSELSKKINHLRNKGVEVIFNILTPKTVEIKLQNQKIISVKGLEIGLEGFYKINGWSFIGTIEHTEIGNIIRLIDSSLETSLPVHYKTTLPLCEHCNTSRTRKDTYIIYHEETKQFKQVGKSCLKEYTNGLDANTCIQLLDIQNFASRLENDENEAFEKFTNDSNYLEALPIKKIIYGYVKQNGYTSQSTVRVLSELIFGLKDNPHQIGTLEEVEAMNIWVENQKDFSLYMSNAKTAWLKKYTEYRDLALMASLANIYFKDMAKNISNQSNPSAFVGQIKDKITIHNIKSIRTLYIKPSRYYQGDDAYLYEIIDNQKNIYLWSTTNFDLSNKVEQIETITATIKDHKEYKGIKQTVITNGKISYKETL